jgi:hypothetical protein
MSCNHTGDHPRRNLSSRVPSAPQASVRLRGRRGLLVAFTVESALDVLTWLMPSVHPGESGRNMAHLLNGKDACWIANLTAFLTPRPRLEEHHRVHARARLEPARHRARRSVEHRS